MRGGATAVNETQKWATSKKKVENHRSMGLVSAASVKCLMELLAVFLWYLYLSPTK
jgi:hypothetical protein